MANTLKLWISPETGRLLASATSLTSAPAQVFYSGNTVDIELHLIEGVGVARTPYEVSFPAGADIQVAVGTVAKAPLSGQWRLSVSSTETADLAYNASASAVQTALNALSAVSTDGGVTVAALGGGYSITWNTAGTKPAILAGSDTLAPASSEAILVLQAGDVSTREIVFVELRQSPLALANSFTPIGTPVVTADTVSAWNGTNKVVRVKVLPAPKSGSFTIDVDGDTAVIQAFSSNTDVQVALLTAGVTSSQSVSMTGVNQYDIIFTSDVTVTVDGSGLIASPGMTGTISFATSELIAYLGSDASRDASIEITATSGSTTQTYVQTACKVANGVVASGAVAPVPAGTLLTESVANARFIRRDTSQSPSAADLDIIWPNLGVSTDGSNTAAAISNSNSPASGNPFATIADIPAAPDLSGYLTKADNLASLASASASRTNLGLGTMATEAASDYLTKAGNLSGIASASTARNNLGLGTMAVETASNYLTTSSASSTYLSISSAASNYLTISTAAVTYALQSSFDQGVKTTDSVSFYQVTATDGSNSIFVTPTGISLSGSYSTGIDSANLYFATLSLSEANGLTFGTAGQKITFVDATTQDTRVVRESQANGGGYTNAGYLTHYPDEVKVIDDTGTAYWVAARPA